MTGIGAERSGVAVAHAVLDGNGRLRSADPVLDRLNRQAGGDVGQPPAVPALATVVRLARRLGIMVSRRALAADEKGDVEMWARAQPDGKGVRLAVSGWQERPGWTGVAGAGGLPGAADDPDGKWRWDTDAALRLTQVSIGAGRRHGFDAIALLGQPVTTLLMLDGEDGPSPLVDAVARREPLTAQGARLRANGKPVTVSATVRRDAAGRFGGFIGGASRPAGHRDGSAPAIAGAGRRVHHRARPFAAPAARLDHRQRRLDPQRHRG